MRLLIADDHPLFRLALVQALRDVVPRAEEILEAGSLAQARDRLAAQPDIDLILLDLHLPDASGMEVLRLLKTNPDTAGIPVIMVSADAMPEQVEAALAAGAQNYQTKPVHLPALLQLIDELLGH